MINPTHKVCVIIPVYQVENHIQKVIRGIPSWIRCIIVVDDASPDESVRQVLALNDSRVVLVHHKRNQGVGKAMLSGYNKALELECQIMIKMDGDNQMSPQYLPDLINLIIEGKADYVKGNRFANTKAIIKMPITRRWGNLGLSFLTKAASGYWNIFDPNNGYVAIRADIFRQIDQSHIHHRYFFESSMLLELNLLKARVVDVLMPAQYADEISSMSLFRTLFEFPILLLQGFRRRLWLQYFVLDFSVASLFTIIGVILCLFGVIWGTGAWIISSQTNTPATTGTVMISVLPLVLGFQLLLQAIVFDVQNVPH